ncbi:MAG: hypothetical protein ACXWK4_05815, partial [Myxococcaceae bacterium]
TDVDLTDTHTVSQAAPAFTWSGGTLGSSQQTALTAASTLTLNETDSTDAERTQRQDNRSVAR